MHISLLNYLKKNNQLDIPLWFNKILESHSVDLIAVPGELTGLDCVTMQYFEYKEVVDLANKAFLKPSPNSYTPYINVIAVDRTTEKILGYAKIKELSHSLHLNDLASISNSPSLKNLDAKIPLIGSILITAATLLCMGKNKNLEWIADSSAIGFYDQFKSYGVKEEELEYYTPVINSIDNIIPPKSYYEKYFPELKHTATKLYSIMDAVKTLALTSRRGRILDKIGGEKTVIPKYSNFILIDENYNVNNYNNWMAKNTIIMQKKGDSLIAYWGEQKEFSLSLPLEEKEIENIFALLQKKSVQEKDKLLARIISVYGCSIIGNNYDQEYHNKKAVFNRLRMNVTNASKAVQETKQKLQKDDSEDSDKKSGITISGSSSNDQ